MPFTWGSSPLLGWGGGQSATGRPLHGAWSLRILHARLLLNLQWVVQVGRVQTASHENTGDSVHRYISSRVRNLLDIHKLKAT